MFKASLKINKPINVIVNSPVNKNWAQIKCAVSGKILHTGRVPYIERVAKQRYNQLFEIPSER